MLKKCWLGKNYIGNGMCSREKCKFRFKNESKGFADGKSRFGGDSFTKQLVMQRVSGGCAKGELSM